MTTLLIILIPILVADMINPVLLGGTIYSLGTRHPIVNGCLVLFSYFITYFLAGVIITVSFEFLSEKLHLPPGFDYVLEVLVALLLFYMAWNQWQQGDTHPEGKLPHETPMSTQDALWLGLQVNLVGLPFAIPYLAAIDQILKANLAVAPTAAVLLLYNALYILPFALLVVIRFIYKEESDAIFTTVNRWMHTIFAKFLPVFFVLLGILLMEDGISYLIGYREYSFMSLLQS